ncbi:AlpA family phage regulatory protein [Mangrovimicrobium sediminis]|uniref:AlpA family phage regulatory protein n=1 Tax=Mangrovimicrobium sediminis TaxID=2562682 RepID=A0A4Z0M0M1_9GAMM|nr:AlpA family phage regulatory protein [Haliea sp. SAOS-164]
MPSYDDLPKTGLLRDRQIYPFFGIGRSTWWKWVKEGKAPPGIKLGSRTTVWRAEDVRQLLLDLSTDPSTDSTQ